MTGERTCARRLFPMGRHRATYHVNETAITIGIRGLGDVCLVAALPGDNQAGTVTEE